jgi:hypothetical protein
MGDRKKSDAPGDDVAETMARLLDEVVTMHADGIVSSRAERGDGSLG